MNYTDCTGISHLWHIALTSTVTEYFPPKCNDYCEANSINPE